VLCRAVQDASTASLVWVLTLMAEHPDVLERVRAEQAAARPDLNQTITGDTLAQMPYTRQVQGSWQLLSLAACADKCQCHTHGPRLTPKAFGSHHCGVRSFLAV
jgi:hypothetical protein